MVDLDIRRVCGPPCLLATLARLGLAAPFWKSRFIFGRASHAGASSGQCQEASPGRAGQGRSGLVTSRSSRRVVYSDMSLYLFVPFS